MPPPEIIDLQDRLEGLVVSLSENSFSCANAADMNALSERSRAAVLDIRQTISGLFTEFDEQRIHLPEYLALEELCSRNGKALATMPNSSLSIDSDGHISDLNLYSGFSDISPLAWLPNLTSLDLSYNPVLDFLPLAGLRKLEVLQLHGTGIGDLSPLKSLLQLRELQLGAWKSCSLTPLEGLTNLTRLDLSNPLGPVRDLTPLAGLKNLLHLDLEGAGVTDISALSGLKNLCSIYLYENTIADLRPLLALTNLQHIKISFDSSSSDHREVREILQSRQVAILERGRPVSESS